MRLGPDVGSAVASQVPLVALDFGGPTVVIGHDDA